ncbi:hypothetical protein BX616_005396, partial [Lobosporangium transversale]
ISDTYYRSIASFLLAISAVIIPQSMAYAMLASLPPVHGLYTSLVPTAVYACLGTSRHMSTGTFAITSLLLGQFTHKILTDQGYTDDFSSDGEYQRRYLPLCLLLTFFVGIIQILLSMARLGQWTSKHLLPTALVSGFNTASAFHIGTHQVKHLLGLKPPRETGAFSMIKTWIWFAQHFWGDTLWASFAMGLAAMALMYVLQRIEHQRRSEADRLHELSFPISSPIVPQTPSSLFTFPQYRSTVGSSPKSKSSRSGSHRGNNTTMDLYSRKRLLHRRGIVPSAVSDQALLTAQDVAIENAEQSMDSSPNRSPTTSPVQRDDPVLPTFHLPSSSRSPYLVAPEPSRSVHINTKISVTPPLLHSPTSPNNSGLSNTAEIEQEHRHGYRQDRARLFHNRSTYSSRAYRYKPFRSLTPSHPHRQRGGLSGSESEHEPLLSHNTNHGHGHGHSHGLGLGLGNKRRKQLRRGSATSSCESTCGAPDYSYSGPNAGPPTTYSYSGHEHESEIDNNDDIQQSRTGMEDNSNHHEQKRWWSWLVRGFGKVHFPIPDIFICVIVFTAATVIFDLDKQYGIEVIGYIPTGLPTVAWPPTMVEPWKTNDFVPMTWPSLLMAMVVYVMSLSVAKHFGKEYGYEVDADQEMLALGAGSLVGSCFGGYVCTGSLTRSAILAQLGAQTLLATLVGAFMVLMSLLWFTVLFERIPDTVLAAIVLVALSSLLAHTMEARRLWRVGRRKEALVWWITFVAVLVFSIEIGLAVGMAVVGLLKLYKHGSRWKKTFVRSVKQSSTYQRLMLMLGLQSPLYATAGRGLYTGDDENEY